MKFLLESWILSFNSFILSYAGTKTKEDSSTFYQAADDTSTLKFLSFFVISVFCVVIVPPAFLPLVYAITKFPDPKNWFLPVNTVK